MDRGRFRQLATPRLRRNSARRARSRSRCDFPQLTTASVDTDPTEAASRTHDIRCRPRHHAPGAQSGGKALPARHPAIWSNPADHGRFKTNPIGKQRRQSVQPDVFPFGIETPPTPQEAHRGQPVATQNGIPDQNQGSALYRLSRKTSKAASPISHGLRKAPDTPRAPLPFPNDARYR